MAVLRLQIKPENLIVFNDNHGCSVRFPTGQQPVQNVRLFPLFKNLLSIKKPEKFPALLLYFLTTYLASEQKILYCTAIADLKYSLIFERSDDALCFVK